MNSVIRGKFSRFTHESKFTSGLNTSRIAAQAILDGEKQRESLRGRRIILSNREPSDEWQLKNAFRL